MWYKIRGRDKEGTHGFFIVEAADIGQAVQTLCDKKPGMKVESADATDYIVIPK